MSQRACNRWLAVDVPPFLAFEVDDVRPVLRSQGETQMRDTKPDAKTAAWHL
ncbi:MAG: hypothetical protein J6386_01925 [Candidatus Synoicihabitans palmerolidicus]|nr:hypothetical protein [Candidatus Synoicihabitans palmerolidicus]